MSLFGSKKKKHKLFAGKPNLNEALSKGRIEKLKGCELEKNGLEIELFHITALMSGSARSEINNLERKIFGKTFEDLLRHGYQPSLAIKDDNGSYWTAKGKS